MALQLKNRISWRLRMIRTKLKPLSDRLFRGIKLYRPKNKEKPSRMIEVPTSAWKGLELIVKDIMQQSETSNKRCLEFGVEYGYSVAVFANYFEEVTGVDIFTGDIHAGFHGDILEKTKNNLRDFPNIKLIRSDYKDYITRDQSRYDLIHVDIVHTYEATYDCGLWSALHADCTIFHDTETFPEVKKAVRDIARKTGKQFYNYPHHCGLGIVY